MRSRDEGWNGRIVFGRRSFTISSISIAVIIAENNDPGNMGKVICNLLVYVFLFHTLPLLLLRFCAYDDFCNPVPPLLLFVSSVEMAWPFRARDE